MLEDLLRNECLDLANLQKFETEMVIKVFRSFFLFRGLLSETRTVKTKLLVEKMIDFVESKQDSFTGHDWIQIIEITRTSYNEDFEAETVAGW